MAGKAKTVTKWRDLRKQSAEEINDSKLDIENEKAYNKCNNDISTAKEDLSARKEELMNAKRANPFSLVDVLTATRKVALAEKNILELKALKEEMFDPID